LTEELERPDETLVNPPCFLPYCGSRDGMSESRGPLHTWGRGRSCSLYRAPQELCRVEIDRAATCLGKTSTVETEVFIPDGKPHGKHATISRWVGDKLQIGKVADHVYYGIDSSRNLHMSDGRSYPQCNGPCDEVAEKVN
jgi:hypothetical protein